MANGDEGRKDIQQDDAGGNTNNIRQAWRFISAFLTIVGAIYSAFKIPNEFKVVVLCLVALLWILFELNNGLKARILNLIWRKSQQGQKTQTSAVRWGLGGLLLLFILGWGYEKLNEPPTIAGTIYYMVVLDASDTMKEQFDTYPSKWVAVREAFQEFYDRSHPDSNYGLVLIGGQNPREGSKDPCSLPTIPLIPVVSESGKALPHSKLTLPNLQDQIEGQQPQGGASLSRAFFLAKNHLESLKSNEPISTMVIVLIANASDSCAGKIDWDTLAGTIELTNAKIAVRKELILLDVEATQEVTAFAEQMNAMNDPNMFVQVVTNYYELKQSISFVIDRGNDTVEALQATATAIAQNTQSSIIQPTIGGQGPATFMTLTPTRRVVVASSATSTPTLTYTATSTFTPTFTFTPSLTFTPSATATFTLTCTPTTPPPIIVYPTYTKDKSNNPPPPPPPVSSPTEDPCCKHCVNSQACGNSCIPIGNTCTQPPGCACDG